MPFKDYTPMTTTQRLAELATTGSPSIDRFPDFEEYSWVVNCTTVSLKTHAEY